MAEFERGLEIEMGLTIRDSSQAQQAQEASRQSYTTTQSQQGGTRGHETFEGWLQRHNLGRYSQELRQLASEVQDLEVMTDSDVDELVASSNMPKLAARRLRAALVEVGAQVTLESPPARSTMTPIVTAEAVVIDPNSPAAREMNLATATVSPAEGPNESQNQTKTNLGLMWM